MVAAQNPPDFPATVPNMLFWFRADDLNIAHGAQVTRWNDRSANAFNLTATTGVGGGPTFISAPALLQNSRPYVSGTQAGLTGLDFSAFSAVVTGLTAFWVTNLGAVGVTNTLLSSGFSGFEDYAHYEDNFFSGEVSHYNAPTLYGYGAPTAATWGVSTFWQDMAGGVGRYYRNLTLAASVALLEASATLALPASLLTAMDVRANRSYEGLVGEAIAYTRALTAAERTGVINYLMTKWGI